MLFRDGNGFILLYKRFARADDISDHEAERK